MEYDVRPVSRQDTLPYILDIHYAARMPSVSFRYGLFRDDELVGVVTYGKPCTHNARRGVCGEDFVPYILELNRLCLRDNLKLEASRLVSGSLRLLKQDAGNAVIVSFADTEQEHSGIVYQATNFTYTGLSAKRTDYAIKGEEREHNMTICDRYRGTPNRVAKMREDFGDRLTLVPRPRKHRYILFIGSKGFRAKAKRALRYTPRPYPKVDNPGVLTQIAA